MKLIDIKAMCESKELPSNVRKAISTYGGSGELNRNWDWTDVSLGWLAKEVWNNNKRKKQKYHKDFHEYHTHYQKQFGASWSLKNPDSIWPIILGGPPGGPYLGNLVILDGNHRFHHYLDRYADDQQIPVVWPV